MTNTRSRKTRVKPRVTIVWEFRVRPDRRREFEKAYGPRGVWARFFESGEGYFRSQLMRDVGVANRYLVLDIWNSLAAYERFKAARLAEYQAIDQRCESLTEMEVEIGRLVEVGNRPRKR